MRAAEDLASDLDCAASTGFDERCDISSKAFVDDSLAILNEGLTAKEMEANQEQIEKFKHSVYKRLAAKEVRARQDQQKKVMKAGLSEEAYSKWLRIMEPKFLRELGEPEASPDADLS